MGDQGLSRFFCNDFLGGGGMIIILIIAAILLLGDDIFEWLFCDDMALIWVILIVLLLTNLDFDNGCCC